MPPDTSQREPPRRRLRAECLAHLDALYGAALRMTRDADDAQDLVQDTYLKAIRNLDRYRDDGSCKAWLFRILTNTYIDRYRKSKRAPAEVAFDDERGTGDEGRFAADTAGPVDVPGSGEGGPIDPRDLEEFLSRVLEDEVKAAIDAVPDVFREALVLRDLEGFSYQEIAELLRIPIGTVMSRLYRGRRLLQEQLDGYAAARGYTRTAGQRE